MEDTILKLELSAKQVNLILAHLCKGVYAEVAETIANITNQGNTQLAQKPVEPPPNP